jgi:dihydrolipoamide dehydrogenase
MKADYDLLVIGAGPAGYVGGIRAAQLGLKTAVIEKDKPGGVCLNMGCIPSKALIYQAELFRSLPALAELGVAADVSGFSYRKVFAASRKAADRLSKGVEYLLKKNEVDLIRDEAFLEGPGRLRLAEGRKLAARYVLIVTGSLPRVLPGFEFDEQRILSSRGALMLEELPASICILGGGAIGVEFAHIMNSFGVEVHLVEMLEQLLPGMDSEAVAVLASSFKKRGIRTYLSTRAESFKPASAGKKNSRLSVLLAGPGGEERLEADKLLVVTGRVPNSGGVGLEQAGIVTEKGFIPVGDYYQTAVPGIFAAGDVLATPMLAHAAYREAEIAVEFMAGGKPPKRLDPLGIPAAVYCEPQIAGFGYSEAQAREAGLDFKKAVFPYRGAGKAVAVGSLEGLVKILTDGQTGEILGAAVAGSEATELIHELLLARSSELLAADLVAAVHAHPTFSEAVSEAARLIEGRAIHI